MPRVAIFAVVMLTAGPAMAQEMTDYSGSYICIDEFGGGLRYDETAKRWQSAKFNPTGRFVLSLTMTNSRPAWEGSDLMEGVYDATVSEFGRTEPDVCYGGGEGGKVEMWGPTLRCTAALESIVINLETMRFLSAYQVGFVEGEDNNNNTPWMMGGTCAKID